MRASWDRCQIHSFVRLGGWLRFCHAALFRLGRINTSAAMPSRSCKRRIIVIDSPRFRFRTSAIRVRVPMISSRSVRVSPCCSIWKLMASIGQAGPSDNAQFHTHRRGSRGHPADRPPEYPPSRPTGVSSGSALSQAPPCRTSFTSILSGSVAPS